MRKQFSTKKNDEYYTPKYVVDIIEPYCRKYKTIWCPFDLDWSNYVKTFQEMGYNVIYTHIDTGQDFLTYEPDFEFDVIITNPAFSIKNEVLEKCYSYNKPFCLLLPLSMLSAKSTIKIMSKGIQFLMIDDRISYDGNRPNFTSWYFGGNNFFEKDTNFHLLEESPCKLWNKEYK